jgi:peptidoglycan/LPS O-acetylase OafA/YrhL
VGTVGAHSSSATRSPASFNAGDRGIVAEPTLGDRFRRRFIRRTSARQYIPEIDGLRFPAIAIVVIGHLSSFFLVRGGYGPPRTTLDRLAAAPEKFASEGVFLFFIISGFILALPFAVQCRDGGQPVSLRAYFLRRLTRLEPPYLLTLLGLIALEIAAASHHVAGRTGAPLEILQHGAASSLYLHNLIYTSPSTINPPAWSLEIEVQFYVLVPLLAFVFRIRSTTIRRTLIIAAALASMSAELTLGTMHPRVTLSILGQLQFFLLGFLLADLYLFSRLRDAPLATRWDIVSLVCWILIFALWQWSTLAMAALPFVALVAFIGVFRGRLTNRAFSNPWVTTIGGMCYSIYLVHFELIAALGRGIQRVIPTTGALWKDLLVQGIPVLGATLIVCVAFFYFIERPCMDPRWPSKLLSMKARVSRRALA